MTNRILIVLCLVCCWATAFPQSFLIEAESFDEKGGWVIDPQFVEQMGSPYLMAHGMGMPVHNAKTTAHFPESGRYHVWVRTKNWVPGDWEPPGKFHVRIGDQTLENEFGVNPSWSWEYGGEIDIKTEAQPLELIDLTGFNGRCDAIYLSTENAAPPDRGTELAAWRKTITNQKNAPEKTLDFDYVVVGGGIAGCASAIAAAEQGMKVALIHERPVMGGNASSEIRVHTLGRSEEHTSELQSLMRTSYAVFCLKKKKTTAR